MSVKTLMSTNRVKKGVVWKGKFWRAYLEIHGPNCYYCKAHISRAEPEHSPTKATIDHRIPISKGGTNTKENMVWCCYRCNQKKGLKFYSVRFPPKKENR